MSSPLQVLVVIVSFRSARLALRCLESLAGEARSPRMALSVVVVENASGEEAELARGIAEPFSSFARPEVSPVNGGLGAGQNPGVRTAHELGLPFDYVLFLNPDTEVRPGAVLTLARFLEAHPRAGLASGSFEHADGTVWPIAFRFPSAASELETACGLGIVSHLLRSRVVARTMGSEPELIDWCSGASMMVRREVREAVGGFDEEFFMYCEDTDLCRRLQDLGLRSGARRVPRRHAGARVRGGEPRWRKAFREPGPRSG